MQYFKCHSIFNKNTKFFCIACLSRFTDSEFLKIEYGCLLYFKLQALLASSIFRLDDGHGNTGSVSFTVSVQDVNDITPTIDSHANNQVLFISEGSTPSETFMGSDAEPSQVLTFSLGTVTPNNIFTFSQTLNTGTSSQTANLELLVGQELDFEVAPEYVLEIR